MLRERQADFSTGSVLETSFLRRPDAVVPLTAFTFGPRAKGDPSEGLLIRGWYARADNAAGKVYLAGAREEPRLGWQPEVELFSFAGDAIDELDVTTDQNGNFVVVAERAGHVWIYYFKPLAGAYVFEDFGVGRNPRCILDDPRHPDFSDILVFYVRAGEIQVRTQSDLYATEASTGELLTDNQYIEGTIRDRSLRLHLVISEHDPITGQYAINRLTSLLYPYYPEPESIDVAHVSLAGTLSLLVRTYDAEVELLGISHGSVLGELLDVTRDESAIESMDVGVPSIDSITLFDLVIPYAAATEELTLAHASLSGTLDLLTIIYAATTESVNLTHGSISGTLTPSLPVTNGLVAWHDAQAITGNVEGDALMAWADGSGSSNPLSSVGTTNPLYRDGAHADHINGHPCVRIVADATCYLQYASYILSGASAGEIFAVLKNDADPAASAGRSGLWAFSQSNFDVHHPYTDGKIYEAFGRASRVDCGNPAPSLAAMHVYNVLSRSGEWTVNLNGAQLYTTATNTVSFLSSGIFPRIGRSQGSSYNYAGLIGEVLVFNRALTAQERTEVYNYLAAKWAA